MRSQTTFENISKSMNGKVFGFFFIALRIIAGISILYSASSHLTWTANIQGDITNMLFIGVGVALLLGLLVRPFSMLGMLQTSVGAILLLGIGGGGSDEFFVHVGLFFMFGLFASGGAGHAVGLDGLILRNIRQPGRLVRFLFG